MSPLIRRERLVKRGLDAYAEGTLKILDLFKAEPLPEPSYVELGKSLLAGVMPVNLLFWLWLLFYWVYDEFEYELSSGLSGIKEIRVSELELSELFELLTDFGVVLVFFLCLVTGAGIGAVMYLVRRNTQA